MSDKITNEINKRKKFSVYWMKFLKLYSQYSDSIVCFVEGEDTSYYLNRVENQNRNKMINFISSNGKQNVIKFYYNIKEIPEYRKLTALFFVDRDFDQSLGLSDIYETPCYSIENTYTTISAFERIVLSNTNNLTRADNDFKTILEIFVNRQREFHNAICLLNAWLACQREIENQNSEIVKLNIGNLKLTDFVNIDLGLVTTKYNLQDIKNKYPDAPNVDEKLIEEKSKMLMMNPQKLFRGKFEIEFLRLFLEILIKRMNNNEILLEQPRKLKLSITKQNVISDLSLYADTPNCLITYVQFKCGLVSA